MVRVPLLSEFELENLLHSLAEDKVRPRGHKLPGHASAGRGSALIELIVAGADFRQHQERIDAEHLQCHYSHGRDHHLSCSWKLV